MIFIKTLAKISISFVHKKIKDILIKFLTDNSAHFNIFFILRSFLRISLKYMVFLLKKLKLYLSKFIDTLLAVCFSINFFKIKSNIDVLFKVFNFIRFKNFLIIKYLLLVLLKNNFCSLLYSTVAIPIKILKS